MELQSLKKFSLHLIQHKIDSSRLVATTDDNSYILSFFLPKMQLLVPSLWGRRFCVCCWLVLGGRQERHFGFARIVTIAIKLLKPLGLPTMTNILINLTRTHCWGLVTSSVLIAVACKKHATHHLMSTWLWTRSRILLLSFLVSPFCSSSCCWKRERERKNFRL